MSKTEYKNPEGVYRYCKYSEIRYPEQIFTFEMWDAEVKFTVINNNFFHEENGKYYSNLFQFEMVDFDHTEEWSEYRGKYEKGVPEEKEKQQK